MSRVNQGRTVNAERNLAHRIKLEREDRGWSPEQLARRMTAAGCSIATSSVYRIEDRDKPRKITVDELVALAEVFEVEDVRELLRPMDDILQGRAEQIAEQIRASRLRLVDAVGDMLKGLIELVRLINEQADRALLIKGKAQYSDDWFEPIDYAMNLISAPDPSMVERISINLTDVRDEAFRRDGMPWWSEGDELDAVMAAIAELHRKVEDLAIVLVDAKWKGDDDGQH